MNEIIIAIIVKWANKICADVHREWARHSGIEGKAKIDFKIVEKTVDMIVGRFEANGQKAWICEYGKGSSSSAPDIAKYRQTKYWNSYRSGMAISGRGSGSYYDLDDKEHTSSGKNRGKNLESTKIPKYQPIPPEKTIENIVMNQNHPAWKLMMEEIEAAMKRYIISLILPDKRFTLKV